MCCLPEEINKTLYSRFSAKPLDPITNELDALMVRQLFEDLVFF